MKSLHQLLPLALLAAAAQLASAAVPSTINYQGRLTNAGFLDYRMPVASDLPMIDAVMVEVPNPAHPYGVKGVGEVPIVPPLAAVANAASAACGIRLYDLPLAPDRIHALLQAKA